MLFFGVISNGDLTVFLLLLADAERKSLTGVSLLGVESLAFLCFKGFLKSFLLSAEPRTEFTFPLRCCWPFGTFLAEGGGTGGGATFPIERGGNGGGGVEHFLYPVIRLYSWYALF